MLVLSWRYLGNRARATDFSDRSMPEWPPHPDRVFQALVAAWGGRGEDPEEARALRALCELGPPAVACPLLEAFPEAVTHYVPVNDVDTPRSGEYRAPQLALLPDKRKRVPRTFPEVFVGDAVCSLIWPEAEQPDCLPALARLASAVTHVGHSTSLVHMWVNGDRVEPDLVPDDVQAEFRLRVPHAGRFDTLVCLHAARETGAKKRGGVTWHGYSRHVPGVRHPAAGDFDHRLWIIARTAGAQITLRSAPTALAALRGMLMSAANADARALRLVSGHEPCGAPLASPHVAILPLAFVGDPLGFGGDLHADGRVLGFGLALPRLLAPEDEAALLSTLVPALRSSRERSPSLRLHAACHIEIDVLDEDAPPLARRPSTWTRPADHWASITPVALDRSPPRRITNLEEWSSRQISEACLRQGLPEPTEVAILGVPFWRGVPAAGEYPALLRKDGSRRWHVHARLKFDRPIRGPLVLGAGRYRGYGFFRPFRGHA